VKQATTSTNTSSAAYTWSDYTGAPTTTSTATSTKGWTTSYSSASTTTSSKPAPTAAVCPNDSGKTILTSGSCGCSFQINCAVRASPGAGSKFWQKDANELVDTLDACNAQCNENALCETTLW
jgi:hypothetical protein